MYMIFTYTVSVYNPEQKINNKLMKNDKNSKNPNI